MKNLDAVLKHIRDTKPSRLKRDKSIYIRLTFNASCGASISRESLDEEQESLHISYLRQELHGYIYGDILDRLREIMGNCPDALTRREIISLIDDIKL